MNAQLNKKTQSSWRISLIVCFIVGCFLPKDAFSQDTISLFYTGGKFRLLDVNRLKLDNFIYSHDLSLLDSVGVIGFADSTGNSAKNQKLSQRRAKTVANYLDQYLKDGVRIKSYARGEEDDLTKPRNNHRRVEVILYFVDGFKTIEEDKEIPVFTNTNNSDECYELAYTTLAQCDASYFIKGKTRYARLELEAHQYTEGTKIFTLSSKTRAPKLVKWKPEITGQLWWKRTRYVAAVKALDFEAYGLVVKIDKQLEKDSTSCRLCDDDPSLKWEIGRNLRLDAFIMQNVQIRTVFLDDEYLLIVPKEYVNVSNAYYFDAIGDSSVQWFTKNGRKNGLYYFATVSKEQLASPTWGIYTYQPTCIFQEVVAPSYTIDTIKHHWCPPTAFGAGGGYWGLEAGYLNYSNHSAYTGAYFQWNRNNVELLAVAGIDLRTQPYFNVRFDYHFATFSPFAEVFVDKTNRSVVHEFHRVINVYGGTGLNTIFSKNDVLFMNDFHLGTVYINNGFWLSFERIFVECGTAFNYAQLKNSLAFYARVGIQIRL